MRELIDERNERRTVLNQTAACIGIGDIAHLLIGNGEALQASRSDCLVQHDNKLKFESIVLA